MNYKAFVKKTCKEWSKDFDSETNIAQLITTPLLYREIDAKKDEDILEIGCGTGSHIIKVHKKSAKVVGIDFSREMLEIAKVKTAGMKNIKLLNGDITSKFPFKSRSFDKVYCTMVLNNIEKMGHVFSEVRRVLKSNGVFIIADLHPEFNIDKEHWKSRGCKFKVPKGFAIIHKFSEYIECSNKYNFQIQKIYNLRITHDIKKCLSKKSYKKNKDRLFAVLFSLRRN